ncbi:DUF3649 domain-containing protein [Sphingomonas sp. CBMAI 2297]|uniref:DUF3649 domain-containing protein n=1 Tax=Sphingomonas sp. CBMAI 2297 TaxID=2991720 RepID=UPI002453BA17|nr:DUF3649 domain-containing protein [Sphingomonas sp. CBMAI 2297]MDH4744118.1 DUF3649 domain-containing protein [Sphingomonas sp. CBMAI 2297]
MAGAARQRAGWRYRANVAARTAAGTVGAYAVAALFAAALARVLPMPKVEAIMPATLLAFLVGPAVTLWAFLARDPWRAWAGVILPAALFAAIGWLAGAPA